MKPMANAPLLLVLVILICDCYQTQGQTAHPGIRLRVTNKGLQYADDVGIPTLFERLRKDKIKDISRKQGSLEYTLSDIKVERALIDSSSLSTAPGEGLSFQASGIDLDITGILHYKKKVFWFHISDKVKLALKAHGIAFKLKTRIGVDSTGRPTISTLKQDCSSDVVSLDVHFSGSLASTFYNQFRRIMEDKIKAALKKMICREAGKAINKDGAKYLATFPVHRNFSDVAQFDNTLVGNPTFTSQYMDVPLKGEFTPRRNPHATALLARQTLPDFAEVDKMVYIWLTDHVFNTASLVYHQGEELRMTIRPRDLPPSSKFQLNTKSFKMVLYQLYQLYPDRPVFLKVYTTEAPVFTSSPSRINVTVIGNVEVYVTAKNGANIYALTVGVKANLNGSLGVRHGHLTFHTESFSTKVHLVRSAIGKIQVNIGLLQWALNRTIESGKFVKKLNVIGDKGFPLPMLGKLEFEDTAITTGQGFVLIKTNLKYLPGPN